MKKYAHHPQSIKKSQLNNKKISDIVRESFRLFLKEKIEERLATTPFSISVDETTDHTTTQYFAIMTHFYEKRSVASYLKPPNCGRLI